MDKERTLLLVLPFLNSGMTTIHLSATHLQSLDLTPAETIIQALMQNSQSTAQSSLPEPNVRFEIDYPRAPDDPRELSEIPEIRLWFIRLDARYPWLPLLLDWEAGELGRYTAMLVPHQFSPTDGVRYNPEALEIFVMNKAFIILDWMAAQGKTSRARLKFMTQMLGYELDDGFFDLLGVPQV